MTDSATVLAVSRDGAIARLTLNRPDKGNALSSAMIAALDGAIAEAAADPQVRVVVIAAEGRIFCAGHDLAEMRGLDEAGLQALFARCSAMMMRIRALEKPVIARVQGAAVAAGCQLVATCDLAYAAAGVKFGVNGINLGLFCSTPSVALSRAVPAKQALDLLLTGRLITAERAEAIGLVTAAVAAADLDAAVNGAAQAIAEKLPEAVAIGKRLFDAQKDLALPEAYALAGRTMAANMQIGATQDAIDAFIAPKG